MERFVRRDTPFPVSTTINSTVAQRYLRCTTVIGTGFCQQQLLKLDVYPSDPKGERLFKAKMVQKVVDKKVLKIHCFVFLFII